MDYFIKKEHPAFGKDKYMAISELNEFKEAYITEFLKDESGQLSLLDQHVIQRFAALQAPVIMMSQNGQEVKDRERARNDYMVNLKAELEIRELHEKIDHLIIRKEQELIEVQREQVEKLSFLLRKMTEMEAEFKKR
ncbi:DUF1003 domain-containing protein [Sphingobacterium thalpophilum]|uniref:DUF1003 domain-containing protein n=1 Tax=Sphingobacterium thalpophilum TaxID=259 RepID=UPI0024A672C0|nr:DUF1003 domain-containing protein [Sphingobacterium thalpophilum]